MLRAVEGLPINVGILGKGNSYGRGPLLEQATAGVVGYKVHEDWGQRQILYAIRYVWRMKWTSKFRYIPIA